MVTAGIVDAVSSCVTKTFQPNCGELEAYDIQLSTLTGAHHLYVSKTVNSPSSLDNDFQDISSDAVKNDGALKRWDGRDT